MSDYRLAQALLIERLRRQWIAENVLLAIAATPRHFFLPPEAANLAYGPYDVRVADDAVPAAESVARALNTLTLQPHENVFVYGSASGFEAAAVARLAARAMLPAATPAARAAWKACGVENIDVATEQSDFAALIDLRPSAAIPLHAEVMKKGTRAVLAVSGRLIALLPGAHGVVLEDHGPMQLLNARYPSWDYPASALEGYGW
jgi:protein-L-isoaspartate O-methyltransferase